MSQLYSLDHIHPNPWQTRLDDSPDHTPALAGQKYGKDLNP